MSHRACGRCLAVVFVSAVFTGGGPDAQEPPASQQRPVFRAGTHFVRVDAYPTRDGEIIPNLTADDFELLEDGRSQQIDSVQFVRFDELNPLETRRDPTSLADMYRRAADPANRVFVLYFDTYHVAAETWRFATPAARGMIDRMLGPRDLVGVLTPDEPPHSLTLGQLVPQFERPLERLYSHDRPIDPVELQLRACGEPAASPRYRLDKVFSGLEGLVIVLNAMREERKNVILFSDGWSLPGPHPGLGASRGVPAIPRIGVGRGGTLTTGATQPFEVSGKWCDEMLGYLGGIDFLRRWRDLTLVARQKNVAFYPVSPGGVWTYDLMSARTESLLTLASETDGVAVLHTNDLQTGLRRITDDLAAYYLLGYYTSNETWDGRIRQITVRLKASGERIRARRQYRAPTDEEMALSRRAMDAVAPGPAEPTPIDLARADLARLGARATVFARAVPMGDAAHIVVELASGLASRAPWNGGASVVVEIRDADGRVAFTVDGRIAAGARGVLLTAALPQGAGPFAVRARVTDARGRTTEQADTAVDRSIWPGRPAMFHATPSPRSPLVPAAEPLFRRTERLHLEWTLPAGAVTGPASIVNAAGDPLDVPIALATAPDGDDVRVTADVVLAPLAAGDYVIDVTFGHGPRTGRSTTAIRIIR
ncbi:MAG TPA: VWA domain-containing protein [Vicinamibacterales bacterium]|nr:VWA domain-containing protein [Vicinamibacterales bacterium]